MLVLKWANDLFIENPGFKRIKSDFVVISVSLMILLQCCVKQFIPETTEKKNLLIIEGLITDQCESYEIKLSRSQPLGLKYKADPVLGAIVTVSDDRGNFYSFHEKDPGVYFSDSSDFMGVIGRKYSLHVRAPDTLGFYSSYESEPEEMKPVPPIDSIFYEKILIKNSELLSDRIENCQIYLNTHDDSGNGKYFRWDYTETWEFHLHWEHPNFACWVTRKSVNILIKNTSGLARDYINRYPLNYIPETSDRLEIKYSILANQYSISEDEYNYWDKLKSITQDVGGLYDMIPANVPGNISCVTYPEELVLGYFSVSAKASKRIFIKDNFAGQVNLYSACIKEIITNPGYIPGIGSWIWILEENGFATPPYIILTSDKGCVDCTERGAISKPDFWIDK
jgi:Domain of unknown function (DUF4249)